MSLYDIKVLDKNNQIHPLNQYQNQVLLIVNTVYECELCEQFDNLEELYEQFHHLGFNILDFPCNQQSSYAPMTPEELFSYCCDDNYISFPQFAPIDVNGPLEAPLYTYLKHCQAIEHIQWNFTKFLVNRQGKVIQYFDPLVTIEEISYEINKLLYK